MSRLSLRFAATLCLAGAGVLAAGSTAAGAADTWTPAGPLPVRVDAPVFALAADPADGARLLAGTGSGVLLRSTDGGASWKVARAGLGRGVAALAFDPAHPGVALAGTRGAGVWRSADGGATWQQQAGTEARTVRAFAFAKGAVLAGGDQGVLASRDGGPWTAAGLAPVRVSALAVAGDPAAPLLAAGGDSSQGGEALPLFTSGDAGLTWSPAAGGPAAAGSSMVTALAASPGAGRPLLMGTNAGLFASADRGVTWQQLTGGGVGGLPGADFSTLAVAPRHPERLYAASDGGGSDRGGLWASADGGAHVTALVPPQPEVTALAVTADDAPLLVVATFRPADHAVAIWTYRDAGGKPSGAVAPQASAAPPATAARPAAAVPAWRAALTAPETPYLVIAAACLLAVAAALAAYARRGRPR